MSRIGFTVPLAPAASQFEGIEVRFSVEIQGYRVPLTARTTEADINALAERYGGDRGKPAYAIAEAAWQQYYEPQMRRK